MEEEEDVVQVEQEVKGEESGGGPNSEIVVTIINASSPKPLSTKEDAISNPYSA